MATTTAPPDLRKGDKIVASADLRGVPAGTTGKVMLVNGLSWIRYWVRFDNGVTMGSINRTNLATPDEWERKLSGADDQPVDGAGPEEARPRRPPTVPAAAGSPPPTEPSFPRS